MFKIIINLIFMVFPWTIRRVLLNYFFGYEICKTSKIGFSILLSNKLIMKEHSHIGHLNIIKNIDTVSLDAYSKIGNLNLITGFSRLTNFFPNDLNRKCELVLGSHTHITSKHLFDCNGGIYIGKYSTIAGSSSQFLTHSVDVYKNTQTTASINIGDYNFIGTKCVILKNSLLPNYSILGASSLLNKKFDIESAIYAGSPAKLIKEISKKDTLYFNRKDGYVF